MAYIGTKPTIGNFQICDAISVVNGQAAYTMQVGSVNVVPQSANHMIVSLNGVIQKPGSSFTISGSTITFASNLATGDVIDFIQILGDVLDIGVPSDATVTDAKTNFVSTSSAAGLQIKGDGTTDGTLQLNCSQNSHGIKIKSPPHSASASYTLTMPNNDGDANQVLTTDGSGVLSFTTPTVGGITEADQWRLTTTLVGSASPISSNLERNDTSGFGYIGSGMTQSSGIFTFPSTGIYLISANGTIYNNVTSSRYALIEFLTTTNNSSYTTVANSYSYISHVSSYTYTNSEQKIFFDVTDTSNCKIKFNFGVDNGNTALQGNTDANRTVFTFIRLGDT